MYSLVRIESASIVRHGSLEVVPGAGDLAAAEPRQGHLGIQPQSPIELSTGAVTAATTISLFSGATPVGALAYNGVPDPTFSGGFAGIESTIPFNSVRVTFNSVAAPAFALDNIRTATPTTTVPEPSTMLLIGAGIMVLVFFRRTRKGV